MSTIITAITTNSYCLTIQCLIASLYCFPTTKHIVYQSNSPAHTLLFPSILFPRACIKTTLFIGLSRSFSPPPLSISISIHLNHEMLAIVKHHLTPHHNFEFVFSSLRTSLLASPGAFNPRACGSSGLGMQQRPVACKLSHCEHFSEPVVPANAPPYFYY